MSREYLEALKRIRQETCPATYMADFDKNECCDVIEQALKRLEAIDNANPSEALECLENIEADLTGLPKHVTEYDDGFDNYLEDIWGNVDIIKQALLKAQEPKHYLKWEDLEFKKKGQGMKVLLNGKEYTLFYGLDVDTTWAELVSIENYMIVFTLNDECKHYKQFFNDLHLERVEE